MHFFFLAAYVALILFISLASRKQINGISDFLLGSRQINPWMSAFSYGTAYFSAVMFIGYAGKIGWNFGLSTLWIVLGNTIVGSYFAWHVLGRRTREMTHRLNVSTMPELLEVRYESKYLKFASAIIIFVFLVPYSAAVYKGLGFLFEEIFAIKTIYALILMSVLTAIYLFLGGFVAATKIDFIQGIIMIAGVIFMLFFVTKNPAVGNIFEVGDKLAEISPKLGELVGPPGIIPILSLVILTSFGSWGMPGMVHKLYTIRDEKSIVAAKWVSTGFALLITFGGYFTGVTGRLLLNNQKPESYDMIVPQIIGTALPTWVSAIIFVLIISASMSTLASLVLASSSAIAVDLIKGVKPDLDNEKQVVIMRVLVILFVALSFIMAIQESPVLSLAAVSWGAVSGCLFAPYVLGLFFKSITATGVWAGIISALGVTLYGVLTFGFSSPWIPTIGALSIVVPVIVVPVVSLFTKKSSNEHLEHIFNKKSA